MTRPELSELDYLREIERLAKEVTSAAAGERWGCPGRLGRRDHTSDITIFSPVTGDYETSMRR